MDVKQKKDELDALLAKGGPHRLVIKAHLQPVGYNPDTGECARFQPAGFPEIGHVIYDAPTKEGMQKICIIDSAASMANHLEKVMWDETACELHAYLKGLPYLRCVTDSKWTQNGTEQGSQADQLVLTTLTEPHRLASDYFMKAHWEWEDGKPKEKSKTGRDVLKEEFGIVEIKKGKETRTFVPPTNRMKILKTIFKYDPNSLVHGIFFPDFKDIKLSRILTASLEAKGAARVPSSGVKFDPIGMTESGQPIFQKDEETATSIIATFIIDIDLIRSYGREDGETVGLNTTEKKLLLGLSLWKINQLLTKPWRYRTQCDLKKISLEVEGGTEQLLKDNIGPRIKECDFDGTLKLVYIQSTKLFKAKSNKKTGESTEAQGETDESGEESNSDDNA